MSQAAVSSISRSPFTKVKILLLQARHTRDQARQEEVVSFAEQSGLETENFVPFDLLTGVPSLADVRRHDALMVGGSGDYYVSKGNLPDFPAVLDLLEEVVTTGHPTYASCFGFQLIVHALGGRIIYDPEEMEVGTFELRLTADGREDELFSVLPPVFMAQLGHKDRATLLPDGALNLASSKRSPYQALRVPGKPIWASQFHPELTGVENKRRFHRYLDGYSATMSTQELKATLDRFADSPETDTLLRHFLNLVFG